jgi:hypothetical protein
VVKNYNEKHISEGNAQKIIRNVLRPLRKAQSINERRSGIVKKRRFEAMTLKRSKALM